MTVREALGLAELKGCRLVAGERGLDNPIQYVDSMEVPDITPWLKKRELLVTTGYSIKNDTGELIHLIESLSRVQAAGIMIKTRFIGSLPEEALRRADDLGLPVIEAQNDLFFTEIISCLMRCIVDNHNRWLEFSEQIHTKFTELELSGGGFHEIADLLYQFMEMPVIITNGQLEIAALYAQDKDQLRGQFYTLMEKGLMKNLASYGLSEETICDAGLELRMLVRKSRAKQRVCGYIFLISNTDMLDEMHKIILDHAVTAVALEFTKQEAFRQHQNLMDDNLFVDIMMHTLKSEEEARYRAQHRNWPIPPLMLVIFDVNAFEQLVQVQSEGETQDLKREINVIIHNHMRAEGIPGAVISKSDRFFCIISEKKLENMENLITKIIQTAKEHLSIQLTAGYAIGIQSYLQLDQAHNDASDAIKICRVKGSQSSACIEDYRLEQMVLHSKDSPYLRTFVMNSIGKVAQYDRENESDLLKILTELVKHMGVRTKTAEALFLHRNTLLYKIKKLEQLTGYDLSRNENLMKLGIALIIDPFL